MKDLWIIVSVVSLFYINATQAAQPTTNQLNQHIFSTVINHPDRPAADRVMDRTRKPELILPFTQIKAGQRVLELGAGGGYTTELLSRLVGENGKVYAQGLVAKRGNSIGLTNVTSLRKHLLYQLSDVLEENKVGAGSLDAAVLFFTLHDFYLSPRIDQQGVLSTLHRLLKPGGSVIILDNAAEPDAGTSVNQKLHRIGENFIIDELAKAGFKVESKSNALRNPKDDHTQRWRTFHGLHDRFAIRFVKEL